MHARMSVTHKEGDFIGQLSAVLPADNRECLGRSPIFSADPKWQEMVAFATETPQWRVIVYSDGLNKWEVHVEPVHGDLKEACQSLWRTIRKGTSKLRPKLKSLDIVGEQTTIPVLRASVGLVPRARRRDFWLPALTGVSTAAVLVATEADDVAVRGAVPGLVLAAVGLILYVIDVSKRTLVWHD